MHLIQIALMVSFFKLTLTYFFCFITPPTEKCPGLKYRICKPASAQVSITNIDQCDTHVSIIVCLFVLEFYGPVNNKVMSSQSVNSGTVPWQA